MSFGWNCMFRKGSWIEFRSFVLKQRQNVPSRLIYIREELNKIGEVKVKYERIGEGAEQKITEKRVGLEVNANSSLGKLIQAYIAQGGNPFDISMFLKPDSYEWVESETEVAPSNPKTMEISKEGESGPKNLYRQYTQPYGGVLSPRSHSAEESEIVDTSGWLPIWKYTPRRLGGRNQNIYPRADEIGGVISHARKWVTQEIAHLRNNIEARIIKLCDLREQLLLEQDDILFNALSGTVAGLGKYDPKIQLDELHLSNIVTNIDLNFFDAKDLEGEPDEGLDSPPTPAGNNRVEIVSNLVPDFSKPKDRGIEPYYKSLLDDAPNDEEKNTAL